MRCLAFYMLVVALALACSYGAAKDETVDELKGRFESAHPEDRAELAIRIAQYQLRNADKFYSDGRKMAEKLRDIKRTLAFDDQPPVEQAIRRLEDIRTTLLKEMFAKEDEREQK